MWEPPSHISHNSDLDHFFAAIIAMNAGMACKRSSSITCLNGARLTLFP